MEIKAMPQSPELKLPSFGWLTPSRKSAAVGFLLGAIAGYAGGNGHTTQGAIEHISAQYGDAKKDTVTLQRHDNCVTRKADVATIVANSPELDTSIIPYCPPPPKVTVK